MLIDTHCHLDFPCFSENRNGLMSALFEKQISQIIIPSIERQHWDRVNNYQKLIRKYRMHYAVCPIF